jgi:hypothetical protein
MLYVLLGVYSPLLLNGCKDTTEILPFSAEGVFTVTNNRHFVMDIIYVLKLNIEKLGVPVNTGCC